jgi:glyoxylase-like metal-dependent hydrolase (beta-lactamase superfamily II)
MKVHHFSAATLCPPLGKWVINDVGHMVCHCLLVEAPGGLILVETGIGAAELAEPARRLGQMFTAIVRPARDPSGTALAKVESLGFRRRDVRHIFITHLDPDHAGGLSDFPEAQVHLHRPEHDAAMARRTRLASHWLAQRWLSTQSTQRYRTPLWDHGVKWVLHEPTGERWMGFEHVKPIDGVDVALVPLVGHTRGHSGVAVRSDAGWLLHCGDAYYHPGELAEPRPKPPLFLGLLARLEEVDRAARLANRERLRTLAREHPEVKLFCAHDPTELEAMQAHSADARQPSPRATVI